MSTNMNEVNNELTHDKIQTEIAQIFVNIEKMRKEMKDSDTLTAKLQAETAKILKENQWYPAVIASSATLAIVAIVKLFL